MWGIIATWRMALDGIEGAAKQLEEGGRADDAVEAAIREVEDFPYFKSVGYGGLPNEQMVVELDAAFMDGNTLSFGAVGALHDFANPVSVARALAADDANNLLVGEGADLFAERAGFERKAMLTDRAKVFYRKRLAEDEKRRQEGAALELGEPEAEQEAARGAGIASAPRGHDTVGAVCLDEQGLMTCATSTSGLFMKRPGRVGDSPIPGAGFYVDSEAGGAASTGLGEDVMKGCLAYEIVRLMGEGLHPQAACEQVVSAFSDKLTRRRGKAGDISFVAMDRAGRWGAASNLEGFSFVVQTQGSEPQVYLAHPQADGSCAHELASQEWQDAYMAARLAPVSE